MDINSIEAEINEAGRLIEILKNTISNAEQLQTKAKQSIAIVKDLMNENSDLDLAIFTASIVGNKVAAVQLAQEGVSNATALLEFLARE